MCLLCTCTGCLCLHGSDLSLLHECLQLRVDQGEEGGKPKCHLSLALFSLLHCCPEKHNLVVELLAAGSRGSQSMNGIKRNYTNPWEIAHEWLSNNGSNSALGPRFLETEDGGTGHGCPPV